MNCFWEWICNCIKFISFEKEKTFIVAKNFRTWGVTNIHELCTPNGDFLSCRAVPKVIVNIPRVVKFCHVYVPICRLDGVKWVTSRCLPSTLVVRSWLGNMCGFQIADYPYFLLLLFIIIIILLCQTDYSDKLEAQTKSRRNWEKDPIIKIRKDLIRNLIRTRFKICFLASNEIILNKLN